MWANNKIEEELSTDYNELKRCREELADERLGGDGKVTDPLEFDDLKTVTDVRESFGRDANGELRVVKRTDFKEKLEAEKAYESKLRDTKNWLRPTTPSVTASSERRG